MLSPFCDAALLATRDLFEVICEKTGIAWSKQIALPILVVALQKLVKLRQIVVRHRREEMMLCVKVKLKTSEEESIYK